MVGGKFEVSVLSPCLGLWENVWFASADVGVMRGGFGRSRDEQFMRDLVVGLKGKDGGRLQPWRCEKAYCERYHEHDEWAPRTGKTPCRDYM